MTVWSPAPGWPSRSFSRLTGSHVCLPHSSCVGPGTSFKPPQCLEMLMGCNAIEHFWVQITGQAILVRSHAQLSLRLSTTRWHPVGPGGTRGLPCWRSSPQEGRMLRLKPSLGIGLSQQNFPLPLSGPVTFSVALSVNLPAPMFACHIAGVWGQEHLSTHLNAWKC